MKMTFSLGVIALGCRLFAQEPSVLAPAAEAEVIPGLSGNAQEPVTDLPTTPGPHIESITLFPNQGELPSGNAFNNQRFGYVIHGQVRARHESNLFITPDNEVEDFIFTISPGIAVGFGDFRSEITDAGSFRHRFEQFADKNFLYADYTPSAVWFVDHSEQDSVDHDARLEGEWTFQKLTVGLRARYHQFRAPSEDVGDRVRMAQTTASLFSRYQVTGKTSLEISGHYSGDDYSGDFIDSDEWRNDNWLNYQWLPKTQLGLGVSYGYLERSEGPSEQYEQAQLRVRYEASEKLRIGLAAGPEFRQVGNDDDQTNGVFTLDMEWAPADGTYLALGGFRRSQPSGAIGESYTSTGVRLQYRQRMLGRLFFDLTGEYQHANYDSGEESGRIDDLYYIRPTIGFGLASWLTCEVMGEYRNNDSSDTARSFEATTTGIVFNVLF